MDRRNNSKGMVENLNWKALILFHLIYLGGMCVIGVYHGDILGCIKVGAIIIAILDLSLLAKIYLS